MRAAVLLLVGLAYAASAQPGVPALTGRVVDTADILTPATEAALTTRLAAFEDSTSVQIAVLTVPSLNGEVIEEVANRVFRAWALGQASENNGVLLLIARDDRKLRIEVGYGVEGDLTDARSGTIIRDEIVPRFRSGDFDGGVLAGVEAIVSSIAGTYVVPEGGAGGGDEPPGWVFALMFSGIPLGMLVALLRNGMAGIRGDLLMGGMGTFFGLFIAIGLYVATGWPPVLAMVVVVPLVAILLNRYLEAHPVYGPARRKRRRHAEHIRAAQKRGARTVVIDGVTHAVPTASSGGGSGGFSGGGGSSGGGGASGGW